MTAPSVGGHAELLPHRSPQVHPVGLLGVRLRHVARERDGSHRAGLDARLHSTWPTFGAEMGSVDTEVALLRPPDLRLELQSGRSERAGLDALLAADTKVLVDHADIAEIRIWLVRPDRPDRAHLDARRLRALVALRNADVVWPTGERVLLYLDARQRVRGLAGVRERTHHHARAAALALLHVHEKEALGVRDDQHVRGHDPFRLQRTCDADGADANEEATSRQRAIGQPGSSCVAAFPRRVRTGRQCSRPACVIVHSIAPERTRSERHSPALPTEPFSAASFVSLAQFPRWIRRVRSVLCKLDPLWSFAKTDPVSSRSIPRFMLPWRIRRPIDACQPESAVSAGVAV